MDAFMAGTVGVHAELEEKLIAKLETDLEATHSSFRVEMEAEIRQEVERIQSDTQHTCKIPYSKWDYVPFFFHLFIFLHHSFPCTFIKY